MKVKPGDVYFSYPADIHNILADNGEKLEYDYYAFDTDDEVVRRRLEYVTQSFRLSNSRVFRDDKIPTLLGYALNEFTQNDDMSEKTLAGILKQIVVYALRDICDTPQKTLAAGNAQVFSAKISGYLDSHVFSMNALTELSEKFNYNYAYISEIYKKTYAGAHKIVFKKIRESGSGQENRPRCRNQWKRVCMCILTGHTYGRGEENRVLYIPSSCICK